MQTKSQSSASAGQSEPSNETTLNFYHAETRGCSCPIHQTLPEGRDPTTAPLGMEFSNQVTVKSIPRATAASIYSDHHTYRKDLPDVNVSHHGVYFQGNLCGAITYRFGLGGKRALRWNEDGELLARVHTESDFENLPPEIRGTARRIIPKVSKEEIAQREVVSGDKFLEAARICLGVRMPNLASCGLAKSQDKILNYCRQNGVEYLMTFVRADYPASMIRALRGRGWTCTGWSSPAQASNRDYDPVRDSFKWRFIAPVSELTEQTSLGDY